MRVVLGIFCSLFLVACNNNSSKNEEALDETTKGEETELVGVDVDKHGCKASAGYTWSQLQDDCVRIFEEGLTLLPVEIDESEPVFATFVLFNDDKTKVELFLPSEKESIILPKAGGDGFEKDSYSFDAKDGVLYIDGKAAYKEDRG